MRIKDALESEMERLEPGFMGVLRQTRDRCLRALYDRSTWSFLGAEDTEQFEQIEAVAQQRVLQAAQSMLSPTTLSDGEK